MTKPYQSNKSRNINGGQRIPRDFANARPRRMAHGQRRLSPEMEALRAHKDGQRKRTERAIVGALIAVLLVSVAGSVWWRGLTSDDPAPVAQAAAVVSATPTVHQATAWPTPSPVANAAIVTQVVRVPEIVEITRIVPVTRVAVVEVQPTHQPTATPNPTATWQAQVAAVTLTAISLDNRARELEIRREERGDMWLTVAAWFGALLLIGGGIWWVSAIVRAEYRRKLSAASGETTREDIQTAQVAGLEDAAGLIRESIAIYGADAQNIASWRRLNATAGGWSAERWTAAIDALRARGIPVVATPGGGGGTTLTGKNTLGRVYMRLRILTAPSPTAEDTRNPNAERSANAPNVNERGGEGGLQ